MQITLRIIWEQSFEWNSPIYTIFVDFEKVIDSVDKEELQKLLRHYGIPEKYITEDLEQQQLQSHSQWSPL